MIGVQEVTGEFGKAHRRIALNAEIAIFELRVRPGQFERPAADIASRYLAISRISSSRDPAATVITEICTCCLGSSKRVVA
jgi:hypothetical protein